jgi:pectate lyase
MRKPSWFAIPALLFSLAASPAGAQHVPDGWAQYGADGTQSTTGGAGGPTVAVDNADDFKQYVGLKTPYIVQVQGTIDLGGSQATVRNDKTIVGIGADATLLGGLKISHYDNLIVRNLTIRDSNEDGLTIQDARHVWVDHCTFIDAGDGQLDITHAADWITISWCKFLYTVDSGHNFVNLIGHSDSNGDEDAGTLHVTWHHNWWSTLCVERMPRVRFGRVHLYNNYYNAPGNNYCIRAALFSEVLSESNHFENADEPFEYYAEDEADPVGRIRDIGSALVNATNVYPAVDDVFTPPYPYALDPVGDIPALVIAGAGAGKINVNGEVDEDPPTPDPATWSTAPHATGPESIAMAATVAFDPSGVEYYFSNITDTAHDSGWQAAPSYTDTGLTPNTSYTYTVRTRDKSAAQNETAPSSQQSATTDPPDLTPPTPNPATWASVPQATGPDSIAMTATAASDPAGVEYYFANLTDAAHDSGWQDAASYADSGLTPNTSHAYTVKTRDKSTNQNETAASTQQTATTHPPDNTPPNPDPMTWAVEPHATSHNVIAMTATTAADPAGVEYYFANLTDAAHDSGWQDSAEYSDTGLAANAAYAYTVRARDKSPGQNMTDASAQRTATTFERLVFEESPIGWASVNALGQNGVTGGAGGPVVTVTNLEDLRDYAWRDGPYVIQIEGAVQGELETPIKSDKTIIGLGADATLLGGFVIRTNHNIVIRNLNMRNGPEDGIKMLESAHHVWIDHCDISAFQDGAVDISRGCEYITISWCRFHNHDKLILIGHSDSNGSQDSGHLTVTVHHNWFDHTGQRHPRVRFSLLTHVFNNYFDTPSIYAAASTEGADLLVEGNYFKSVPEPLWSASGYVDSGPGDLAERLNIFENCGTRRETNGSVVEASDYYPYTLDAAADVPTLVVTGAGTGKLDGDGDPPPAKAAVDASDWTFY